MKLFWVFIIINAFFGVHSSSYFRNSRLCRPWTCINERLQLEDNLPDKKVYSNILNGLLPQQWHEAASKAIDVCYENVSKRYTNTCPGQALLQCTVDQLIEFCPEQYWNKKDACSPVTSLAGFKYMFSQSRYENMELNLPKENRPEWFLHNYFSSKCCTLPDIFNMTVLNECGFESMMRYYVRELPKLPGANWNAFKKVQLNLKDPATKQYEDNTGRPQTKEVDPLQCCDMSGFVDDQMRTDCGFELDWNNRSRLMIVNRTIGARMPTRDVKMLPMPCENEHCVFKRLDIVSEAGVVDVDAFKRLLDNFTRENPSWSSARARVITRCLTQPITDYGEECEINKLLACTFDVLSENCPNNKKGYFDPCKHKRNVTDETLCQISSSLYRKNRHNFCEIPRLVPEDVSAACGIHDIYHVVWNIETKKLRKTPLFWNWAPSLYTCTDSLPSAKCLMKKMGVLNKYEIIDYFMMKDKIRQFTTEHTEWQSLSDLYLNSFMITPLYRGYCPSQRKLLNILDAMFITCPISKRSSSEQCNKLFLEIPTSPPLKRPFENTKRILTIFKQPYVPFKPIKISFIHNTDSPIKNRFYYVSNKLPFSLDPMNSSKANSYTSSSKKYSPLFLLPVYQRMSTVRP